MIKTVYVHAYFCDGYEKKGKIDGPELAEDLNEALSELEQSGYEIISIIPILSGKFNYQYEPIHIESSARILRDTEKISGSGGYGYGYGYSHTDGLIIVAREKENSSS